MEKKMRIWVLGMLVASLFVLGCNDDDEPSMKANEKSYALAQLDSSGVTGSVVFAKQNDSTTKVTIVLAGTVPGISHPAHIHANKASDGGPIVLDFNPVDGTSGRSETIVTRLNDGTSITYEELIAFNGHVNVHKSATELAIMIAQGNIGSNAGGTTTNSSATGGNGGY
jgi:hypothetical protein